MRNNYDVFVTHRSQAEIKGRGDNKAKSKGLLEKVELSCHGKICSSSLGCIIGPSATLTKIADVYQSYQCTAEQKSGPKLQKVQKLADGDEFHG